MSQPKFLFLPLSALALGLSQPALGLTAEEFWAEWQSRSAATGQIVSAREITSANGVLTLTGYASRYSDDDADVEILGQLDQVVMTETGDGRVVVTMSDTYSLSASFGTEAGAAPVTAVFNVVMPGLTITASGAADARIDDYAAPRIVIEEGPITGGDGPLPVVDLRIAIEDYAATIERTGSDPAAMREVSTSSIRGIAGAIDLTPPAGEEGRLKVSFAMGPSTATGEGSQGDLAAILNTSDVIPPGFAFKGDLRYDTARLEVTFEHPTDAFALFADNQGGALQASLSETGVSVRLSATGSNSRVVGPELPVPVEVSAASAELGFSAPLAQSQAPQPFSGRLAYHDVVLSPEIWSLLDPAQAIPRDPISLVADITGSVRILSNLLSADPSQMDALPMELVDLALNDARIAIAGAELTASGAASVPPGPMQIPVGSLDLRLSGANALIDRLQNSGLVPVEQLALARGLMGAFTRPGAEPDTVETTIELTEGGGITANGVPLR